jgi:hypothetical protein
MGFKLGNFLKKALNPFSQIKDVATAIKNKDLKGLAAATIPGVGATQSALQGDWKGAIGRSLNPMGEMAKGVESINAPRPSAAGNVAQAMGALGEAEQAAQPAQPAGNPFANVPGLARMGAGAPAGGGGFRSRLLAGGFGGGGGGVRGMGGGGFGGGGMDQGLRDLIQNYYKNKKGGGGMAGGGGGEAVGARGNFA